MENYRASDRLEIDMMVSRMQTKISEISAQIIRDVVGEYKVRLSSMLSKMKDEVGRLKSSVETILNKQ